MKFQVDSRPWSENNNTISLNDDVVIDVPKEWNDIHKYNASLGHKANHSPNNNAKYDKYNHPRFGEIKSIRTISKVHKNEEITVDYGYKKGTGPPWFRLLRKKIESGDK